MLHGISTELIGLAALSGAIALALVLYRPYLGLLFTIVGGQIEFLFTEEFSGVWSIGRTAGLMVLVGWFFRCFVARQSRFRLHSPLNMAAIGFLAVILVGAVTASNPPAAFYSAFRFALLLALLIFTEDLIKTRRQLIVFTLTVAISYGISSITGILQIDQVNAGYSVDEMTGYAIVGQELRMSGMEENPNEYALMLMSGIPFLVLWLRASRSWILRGLCSVLLGMSAYSLVLTAARTHVAAAVAFLAFYLVCRVWYRVWGKIDVILAICMAILALWLIGIAPEKISSRLMETQDPSALMRMELMRKGFSLFLENPIVGVGGGNFRYHSPVMGLDCHDSYGFLFGETGALGVIFVMALCAITFRNQLRMRKVLLQSKDRWLVEIGLTVQAAFIAVLVASFGSVIFYQRMFWIYIGLSAVLANGDLYGLCQRWRPNSRRNVRPVVPRLEPVS